MTAVDVNDFGQEKQCIYNGERYSVRENGAVFRHQPEGKRARPNDNKWTFGKVGDKGYLYIAGVQVHRIVATAFHGDPHDPKYVVDHIDSNRSNNRPENLRWLTRLENALKNPATRKKIEYLCGSIEAFLENPSMLNELQGEPNLKWMRTVTPEEAKNCKQRMDIWASKESRGSTDETIRKSSFGERVYKPLQKWEVGLDGEPGLELSLTPWCAQYMWRAEARFPSCPQDFGTDPLNDYFQNLKVGAVLAIIDSDFDDICPKLKVLEFVILKDNRLILVISERPDNKWSIIGIELDEKSKHFIHFKLGTYSSKSEADEAFCIKKESIDSWSDGYSGLDDPTL
ncbi:MAG: HNH endonuclease [Phycisphaerae bacterium]|nr:HNH endonuclease [Phycisphaerae bacterium]